MAEILKSAVVDLMMWSPVAFIIVTSLICTPPTWALLMLPVWIRERKRKSTPEEPTDG